MQLREAGARPSGVCDCVFGSSVDFIFSVGSIWLGWVGVLCSFACVFGEPVQIRQDAEAQRSAAELLDAPAPTRFEKLFWWPRCMIRVRLKMGQP